MYVSPKHIEDYVLMLISQKQSIFTKIKMNTNNTALIKCNINEDLCSVTVMGDCNLISVAAQNILIYNLLCILLALSI